MLRRIAQFLLWLGIFGAFLFAAAFSTGVHRYDLLLASIILIMIAVQVLRKPERPFEPGRRFRTLHKLGLTGRGKDEKED